MAPEVQRSFDSVVSEPSVHLARSGKYDYRAKDCTFPIICLPEGIKADALLNAAADGTRAVGSTAYVKALNELKDSLFKDGHDRCVNLIVVFTAHWDGKDDENKAHQKNIMITSAIRQKLELQVELEHFNKREKKPNSLTVREAFTTRERRRSSARETEAEYLNRKGVIKHLSRDWLPKGDPITALKIADSLTTAGFSASMMPLRGLDYAAFVPLSIMFPRPPQIIQVSINTRLDEDDHVELGKAIMSITKNTRNVLFVCVGAEYSNAVGLGIEKKPGSLFKRAFINTKKDSAAFHSAFLSAMTEGRDEPEERSLRQAAVVKWKGYRGSKECHPNGGRFMMPYMVALGMADCTRPRIFWEGRIADTTQTIMLWDRTDPDR